MYHNHADKGDQSTLSRWAYGSRRPSGLSLISDLGKVMVIVLFRATLRERRRRSLTAESHNPLSADDVYNIWLGLFFLLQNYR